MLEEEKEISKRTCLDNETSEVSLYIDFSDEQLIGLIKNQSIIYFPIYLINDIVLYVTIFSK